TYEKHHEVVFAGSAEAAKESDHHDDASGRQAEVTGGVVALDLHVVGVGPEGTVASDPNRHTQQGDTERLARGISWGTSCIEHTHTHRRKLVANTPYFRGRRSSSYCLRPIADGLVGGDGLEH